MNGVRPCAILSKSWDLAPLHHSMNLDHDKISSQDMRLASNSYRTDTAFANASRNSHFYSTRTAVHARPSISSKTRTMKTRQFHTSSQKFSTKSSAIPHISLHIAASSSGKGSKFQAEKNTYDFLPELDTALGLQQQGQTIFQKRRARPDSGQDSYFVAPVGKTIEEVAFGICDGVGGWTDHGVDPADFSHGLCHHMARCSIDWEATKGHERLKPQDLIELGYQCTINDKEIKAGGTTACVGIADKTGCLRIANLGDSGYVHLRLGTVQNYSTPQTHAFNTPYQLSLTPPEMLARAMIFGGLPINDNPERADVVEHSLQHGDVLVLATDGLWDNLSSQEILSIVSNQMRQEGAWQKTSEKGLVVTDELSPLTEPSNSSSSRPKALTTLQSKIAAAIVGEAKTASLDRKRDGPFAKAWQKQMPFDPFHGGKVDDISVLVVIPVDAGKHGMGQVRKQQFKAKL